jgi:hypothetical protein
MRPVRLHDLRHMFGSRVRRSRSGLRIFARLEDIALVATQMAEGCGTGCVTEALLELLP